MVTKEVFDKGNISRQNVSITADILQRGKKQNIPRSIDDVFAIHKSSFRRINLSWSMLVAICFFFCTYTSF